MEKILENSMMSSGGETNASKIHNLHRNDDKKQYQTISQNPSKA